MSLCAALPAAAAPGWRVAVEAAYPPFVFVDAQGKPQGLSIEYLERAAAHAGIQLSYLPGVPLQQALAQVRQGEADLITSLASTPARREFLAFTPPYVRVPAVLLLPGQDERVMDLSALAGQRVAVGAGYGVEGYLRSNHASLNLVPVPDDARALELLRAGQVAAAVMDITSASLLLKSQPQAAGVRLGGEVGYEYALSFAARPQHAALLAQLAAGVAAIPLAQRQQLNERWISRIAEPQGRRGGMLAWAALALALLLWLAFAIYTRNRKRTSLEQAHE